MHGTVARRAHQRARVVSTVAIGVLHSQNSCSKRCIVVQHLYQWEPLVLSNRRTLHRSMYRCATQLQQRISSARTIRRTLARSAYHCATVAAMELIGMLHSLKSLLKLVSMCNKCSNGAHRHAPFVELSLDAGPNVQQLQQRSSPGGNVSLHICMLRKQLNTRVFWGSHLKTCMCCESSLKHV